MTKKHTKSALFTSVMALILCFAMLVGTTFAWFTDAVDSGRNTIAAGNLDVELYNGDVKVDSNTKLFDDVIPDLWEPGAVAFENLQVRNVGTLALNYTLNLTVLNESVVNGYKISDVIKVGVVTGGITTTDRSAVVNSVSDWTPLSSFNMNMVGKPLAAGQSDTEIGVVLYWEPNDDEIDNRYNMNNENQGNVLSLEIGVSLTATQQTYENDSFGNDYDFGATDVDPWNGEIPATPPVADEETGEYIIMDAAELAAFAADVNNGNNYKGQTVKLGADINLGNQSWTPIGPNADATNKFYGTFDGQGYTIYNLKVNTADGYTAAGLFGALNGTVKNLTISGASINHISTGDPTDNGIAVVAGSVYTSGTIDNVHVKGATVTGNRYMGGISGYTYGNVTNCSVDHVTLTATPDGSEGSYNNGDKVGGIAGYFASESTYKLSGNSASNVTIKGYRDLGGIVGAGNADAVTNNTASNVTITVDQITNHYEDKDANADAIVGRKLTGSVGSTNTSSNVSVTKATEYAGISQSVSNAKQYYINSKAGLKNLYSAVSANPGEGRGDTITLTSDIDMSGETWQAVDTMWMTLDGNGHTISNLTCAADADGQSGLFAYAGHVTIKNLTLKNVTSTGSQAGAFIANSEGCALENCKLAGNNTITYSATAETYNGIGALIGWNSAVTVSNVEIVDGATVTLNAGAMASVGTKYDNLTGYGIAPSGTVTNNGTIKVNKSATAASSDELSEAIEDGANKITLGAGTYTIPDSAQGKTLTIVGNGSTTIAAQVDGAGEGDGDYSFDGATVTFENVTINTTGNNFPGYPRMKGTFNNCTINGVYTLYENSTFNNCTFNVSGDVYNVWTWGATEATFNGCTFNNDGKAVLLYGTVNTNLTINNCVFNDNGGLTDLKAAIEIGNDYGKSYTLTVNNTTVNGYEINDKGINTGTTLWANKNSMGTDKLNVIVDGVDVY